MNDLMYTSEGVGPAMVRQGEPRLHHHRSRDLGATLASLADAASDRFRLVVARVNEGR